MWNVNDYFFDEFGHSILNILWWRFTDELSQVVSDRLKGLRRRDCSNRKHNYRIGIRREIRPIRILDQQRCHERDANRGADKRVDCPVLGIHIDDRRTRLLRVPLEHDHHGYTAADGDDRVDDTASRGDILTTLQYCGDCAPNGVNQRECDEQALKQIQHRLECRVAEGI